VNLEKLKRRLITIPILIVALLLIWVLLPLWLMVAFIIDLIRRRNWITMRCTLVVAMYVAAEFVGAFGALVLTPLKWYGHDVFIRSHFLLQRWWARTLYGTMERVFNLKTVITGYDDALHDGGPIVVMVRHVSQIDSLIPAAFVSYPSDIVLRYVLKHELLWTPAMDVAGNRLSNHFVRRNAMAGRREIESIFKLGQNMGPMDGAVIFPEGTRFSPEKQKRLLKVMAKRAKSGIYEIAQQYKNVLPPNIGGPKAFLEASPDADVVIVAHTGFDGMRTPKDLLSGDIVGRSIRIHMWRIPRSEISMDEIELWLYEQWKYVDDWVEEHQMKLSNASV
jgi:1-acyl-sn-glycerol-3-phosphate acyltransferase